MSNKLHTVVKADAFQLYEDEERDNNGYADMQHA
jgi:hypothetical protein